MANAPVKNVKSVNRWTPNPAPLNNDQLSDYLFHELNRLSDIIFNLDVFRLEPTFKAPLKSREGDMRYAAGNGTSGTWGDDLGANGIYWYNGTTWTAL
jgi:hypothetical protein